MTAARDLDAVMWRRVDEMAGRGGETPVEGAVGDERAEDGELGQ
jgi:hypothetical protein